jgi:hypothetical protein
MSTVSPGIPPEILGLDFTRLGSAWLNPARPLVSPVQERYRPECHERLARFVREHRVKPFCYRYPNLLALLKQVAPALRTSDAS